jgi:acyl transferase domain-containing protein
VPWRNWFVTGPVAAVQALAAREPRAYVAMVISPQHCVLAGDAQACARVLAGGQGLAAFPVPSFAAHTPVQQGVQDFWRRYYHRPTRPVAGIEFHSGHLGGPYPLSADRVADALTGAILHPQDFPAMAARAWDRGVRVFVEHGPRNLLTSALKRMLPAEQSLCLALDSPGEPGLLRAVRVAAELWCRGVPVDLERLAAGTGKRQD